MAPVVLLWIILPKDLVEVVIRNLFNFWKFHMVLPVNASPNFAGLLTGVI
jgi:hypothetical protein